MKQNNNLENQFRKKLNERTVQPSDKAWDRLDAMLSVSEKKKSKKAWLWVAASLLVLASIGNLFFNTHNIESTPDENIVVEQQKSHTHQIITDNTPEIVAEPENPFALSEKEFNQKTILKDSFGIIQPIVSKQKEYVSDIEDEEIAEVTENPTNIYITAQDLLSSIDELDSEEKHITEHQNKTAISVDYRALLYQAEKEVEERYQKKAIDRFIQKNLHNVGVAISNKHHE